MYDQKEERPSLLAASGDDDIQRAFFRFSNPGGSGCAGYSKLSIKRPVLSNDLKKSLLNDQCRPGPSQKNRSYCFNSGLPRPIFGLY